MTRRMDPLRRIKNQSLINTDTTNHNTRYTKYCPKELMIACFHRTEQKHNLKKQRRTRNNKQQTTITMYIDGADKTIKTTFFITFIVLSCNKEHRIIDRIKKVEAKKREGKYRETFHEKYLQQKKKRKKKTPTNLLPLIV